MPITQPFYDSRNLFCGCKWLCILDRIGLQASFKKKNPKKTPDIAIQEDSISSDIWICLRFKCHTLNYCSRPLVKTLIYIIFAWQTFSSHWLLLSVHTLAEILSVSLWQHFIILSEARKHAAKGNMSKINSKLATISSILVEPRVYQPDQIAQDTLTTLEGDWCDPSQIQSVLLWVSSCACH